MQSLGGVYIYLRVHVLEEVANERDWKNGDILLVTEPTLVLGHFLLVTMYTCIYRIAQSLGTEYDRVVG